MLRDARDDPRSGKTIVFVSHDLGAIREHCDRAMLLQGGSMQSLGSPGEVLSRYDEIIHPTIETPQ